MNDKTQAIAKTDDQNFAILRPGGPDAAEIIAANAGTGDFSALLDRITLPSGGGTSFSVPTMEGEKDYKELEVVIAAWEDHRVYFAKSFDETGGGDQPDCFSNNLDLGVGDPGGECAACPLNEWGSALKGKGKACTEKRMLMLLINGRNLPVKLDVPPSSLVIMRKFFLRLAGEGVKYNQVVVKLSLNAVKNDNGIKYAEVEAKVSRRLDEVEIAGIEAYTNALTRKR